MNSLNINSEKFLYDAMIGVGGIGSGMFFILDGNHTLGREESRSGHLENRKDYCKLHIISHYVQTLLGNKFSVYPIGKVGNDDIGTKLISEMNEAGLKTNYVEIDETKSTLFSICFIYPDKSGGNMTTNDSASSVVDSQSIMKAQNEFINNKNKGIALAVPEVHLEVRKQLLKVAKEHGFFCTASFTSQEIKYAVKYKLLKNVDLLSINLDEATSAVEDVPGLNEPIQIIEKAIKTFCSINPEIKISITQGKYGSWIWDGKEIFHFPALNIKVISTAGAGDAFMSGLIAGINTGLTLKEAQQLGTLTGGASVTSPHTINKEVDRLMLNELMKTSDLSFSQNVIKLMEN